MANLQCQVDILSKAIVKQHIKTDGLNLNAVEQSYVYLKCEGLRTPNTDGTYNYEFDLNSINGTKIGEEINNSLDLYFGKQPESTSNLKSPNIYSKKQDETLGASKKHSNILVHTDSDETCIDGYLIGKTILSSIDKSTLTYDNFNVNPDIKRKYVYNPSSTPEFTIDSNTVSSFYYDEEGGFNVVIKEIGGFTVEASYKLNGDDTEYILKLDYNTTTRCLNLTDTAINNTITFTDMKLEEESGNTVMLTDGKNEFKYTIGTDVKDESKNTYLITEFTLNIDGVIKTIDTSDVITLIDELGEIKIIENGILKFENMQNETFSANLKVLDKNSNEFRNGTPHQNYSEIHLSISSSD